MRHHALGVVPLVAALAAARGAEAQAAAYFQALVFPARSMGTCMPVQTRTVLQTSYTTSRLVMTSIPPGYRREIAVSFDTRGRPFSYTETSFASKSLFTGEGDAVHAALDAQGNVRGWRVHTTTHLSDSVSLKPESLVARTAGARTRTLSSSSALGTDEQREVIGLVKWLRSRCPT